MSFGSPGQESLFQLDTGSTVIWVVNESAALQTTSHHGFDASSSGTFADEGYTVALSYGSGELSVAAARDSLSWNPLPSWSVTAPGIQFGITVNGGGWINNGWYEFESDGIFGLAMPALCQWTDCTKLGWQSLWSRAGYAPVFSLALTPKQDPVPVPRSDVLASAAWLSDSARARLAKMLESPSAATRPTAVAACPDQDHEPTKVSVADAGGPVNVAESTLLAGRAARRSARLGARGLSLVEVAELLTAAEARDAGLSDAEIVAASLLAPGRLSASVARESSMTLGGLNGSHAAAGANLYTIPLEPTGNSGGFGYYWAQLQQVALRGAEGVEGLGGLQSGDDDGGGSNGGGGSSGSVWCDASSGSGDRGSCLALFDSGTSLLALREDVFDAFTAALDAALDGSCVTDSAKDTVVCPASSDWTKVPGISFTFGVSSVVPVPPGVMMQPPSPSGGVSATYEFVLPGASLVDCEGYGAACRVMLMAVPSTVGDINFILGDTFLRSWITLFDAVNHAVSLARSTVGPEPTGKPLPLSSAEIAGIAIGSIVGAGLLAVAGCFVYARCQVARRSAALAALDRMEAVPSDAAAPGEVVFVDGQYVVLTD